MALFQGKVVSIKNDKTAIVTVRRRARHPLYGKAIAKTKRYPVHDEIGVKLDDEVEFDSCRPVSKTKKWEIIRVLGGETEVVKKAKPSSTKKSKK